MHSCVCNVQVRTYAMYYIHVCLLFLPLMQLWLKSSVLCRPWWPLKSPLSPQTICCRLQVGQSMAHMKQDSILKRLGSRRSGITLRSKLCKHDQTAISARQDGNVTAEVIRLLSSTVLIECESLVQVSVPSSLLVQNKQCIVRDFVPCQVVLLQLTYVL